jgi:hypothetical protein
MSFRPDHELHRRRLGRNLGVGGVLIAFVLLVFGMTIEKVKTGTPGEAMLGETTAPSMAPASGSEGAPATTGGN